MDPSSLKQQFEDLQLQQQKKLADRMQRNRDAATSVVSMSDSQSFGMTDDLNLNLKDDSSSSITGLHVALEDANTRMREEIRELKDETGRLRKILGEKDYDVKRLNKRISKMEEDKKMLASAGAVTDSAATKIVELSKRNRDLTAEVEAERTRCLKLVKELSELQKNEFENSTHTPRKRRSPRNTLALHKEPPIENIEELQDKLQATNIKLAEYRNQIQELKQELKIANKVLQQEIGEAPSSMQSLLTNGVGFRGRTQQIMALQDKVKDLEQKLNVASGYRSTMKPDKNFERIKDIEKQRKEQNEELRVEVMKVNDLNVDMQRRMDATKARNKVLVNEIKSLKSQLSILTDKGKHDNELIMTLMKQHEGMQRLVEHNVTAKDNLDKTGVVISKELNNKQQQEQAEISRLRHLLTERDERLRHLEQSLQEMTNVRSPSNNSDSDSGVYRPLAVFNSPSRTSLNQQNNPSQQEHSPKGNDMSDFKQDLEDARMEIAKFKTLYQTMSVEKEKLTELVGIFTQRIEVMTMGCQELNKKLQDEKRKTVKLEHDLEQFKLTKPEPTNRDGALLSARSSAIRVPTEAKFSELETLLNIQVDENAALKESLESTLRAKQEDVTLFSEMMEQTKSVFMDALRNVSSKR